MNYVADIPAAMAAINTFMIYNARELGAPATALLATSAGQPSPVDKIVNTGEALYALGDAGTPETRVLCAQLIEFATRFSWHGLSQDNRGAGILTAMMRDLGQPEPASGWPDPATDPAPRADLVAALAPPAPTE